MPITFVEELPSAGDPSRSDSRETADALRSAPGTWAIIRTDTERSRLDTQARNIRKGEPKAYRPVGHFQSAVRKNDEGTHDLYARFVGEQSS